MKTKHRIAFLSALIITVLLIPALTSASYERTRYPSIDIGPLEKMKSNGEYLVYVLKDRRWKEVGRLTFDRFYRDREIDLSRYLSETGTERINIRLAQRGGGAAHIDSVFLGEKPPAEVLGIENGVKKLSKSDFDVIDAFHKNVDLIFAKCKKGGTLRLTARVEAAKISKEPFEFPEENLFKQVDSRSHFYTYKVNSKRDRMQLYDGKLDAMAYRAPFFKEYCLTGSGHPEGFTYGWVWNDKENLYVDMDFTPDDTMDGDKDYAKVFVNTPGGVREFKVSEAETKWGKPDFTYTDKVAYQHKVYKFKIPLTEIAGGDVPQKLSLAFAAYGTASTITCRYFYEALIDVDNNSSTGGPVTVVQGSETPHDIEGIDYKVRAFLNPETKKIIAIEIWKWNTNTSSFDNNPTIYDYDLGIGNGYLYDGAQADVVEFMASRAALGNPHGTMKIVYHASRAGAVFNDYTDPFYYGQTSIPTLSEWGMIILSLLLGVTALLIIKKRNSTTIMLLSAFLIVLSITGIVSANLACLQKICLDGLTEDWKEIAATPSVIDPYGDSSIGDEWEDIVAGYITSDMNNIYFRIDFVGSGSPTCIGGM